MASTSTANHRPANSSQSPDMAPTGVTTLRNQHDDIGLPLAPTSHSPKHRRLSSRISMSSATQSHPLSTPTTSFSSAADAPLSSADHHHALLLDHDHDHHHDHRHHHHHHHSHSHSHSIRPELDEPASKKSASKKLEKMIAPYLAEHIPQQYNPLGTSEPEARSNVNTKFCYRHRPDMLCRRQPDELTMEMLQEELGKESQADQRSIANVWSLFSAAPSRQRNLMLQGILSASCFPQLSLISSTVRKLLKIDFLSALPTELGFKILCYLDTTSLCKAAQVSRRWRQLADDDVVWHKMCEQHIDRRCTKCGWGLPLLDQRRLRTEKRRIQLRASGRGLDERSPEITPMPESSTSGQDVHPNSLTSPSTNVLGSILSKRCAPGSSQSPDAPAKRTCLRDQQASYFDQPKKRPWKDVYKDRFKVGTNWKYGRYSTRILKGHTNGVMCLQFDDQVLITGSYDATARVWDLASGKEIRTLRGHTEGIRCLQFQDARLITGSMDGTVKIWDWTTGECKRTMNPHMHDVRGGIIGLHMAENLLATGSTDHTVVLHNFTLQQKYVLRGHNEWVNCVKIDLPSRTLFSASDDMTVKLWDLDTKACIRTFDGHAGQVQQVVPLPRDFDIDEADFEDASNDTSDTSSNTSSRHGTSVDGDVAEPLFPQHPDRPAPPSYFITAALDGIIRLWHVPTGRTIHSFFGHIEGVWSLAVDSLRLVSGAQDKMIKIWDPRTGKNERTLTGHTGAVNCVGLSDSRLISGSEDGTVRVHCFVGDG